MKKRLILLLVAALASVNIATAQSAQTPEEICAEALPAEEPTNRQFTEPEQVLEEGVDYRAVLCTGAGPVYVDLFEDLTPIAVNSFVFLAQQDYYNNTTFHRVIEDFMAQGGDPTGTGTGGPGYQFADEFVGFLTFDQPGWLAMANAGPGTSGSQFFITTAPTPHLNFAHTIFGEVLEGQENVEALNLRDPQVATEPGSALDTVVIITDPSSVTTTYEASAPATQEEIVAALEVLNEELPASMTQTITSATTEEVIEAAEDQEAVTEFVTDHEFRVSSTLQNCDLSTIPFMEIGYTLDAFASAEAASAALNSGFLAEQAAAQGLTENAAETLPNPVYSETVTACDVEANHFVTYWQRGRYLVTAEATIPTDSPAPGEVWLSEIVGLNVYENVLGDVLRREIR